MEVANKDRVGPQLRAKKQVRLALCGRTDDLYFTGVPALRYPDVCRFDLARHGAKFQGRNVGDQCAFRVKKMSYIA
jgi:hypothetical protein